MLAKRTSKNQLKLPKSAVESGDATTEYFDVEVRAKLAALGLGDADVADAVRWARSGAKPAALKKATRGR